MPGSPYADLDRPPLREPMLRRGLVVPGGLWTDLRVVPETGSTNADVVAAGRTGAAEGLVLIAERQTAGRGRLDRSWQVPERAGLTISLLLRPAGAAPARWGWLPLLTGVAVVEAVAAVTEVDAALKWPNDLLVRPAAGDRPGTDRAAGSGDGYGKCAGILAEAVVGEHPGVVVGIGLNVSQRADELPAPADPRAYRPTSLTLAGAATTDRVTLVRAVLRSFERWYVRWQAAQGDADACGLRAAYTGHCVTIGQDLSVGLPDGGEITGRGVGIDEDGRLLIRRAGREHVLAAGDVRHVR